MKKIAVILLLSPIIIAMVGLTRYNLQLNSYFKENVEHFKHKSFKKNSNDTEVYIIGTVHFETDSIKRHHFYQALDSISPSIILYEGDSSSVRRITKKTDYLAQFLDAFKGEKRVEKPLVLKYLKNNPDCKLLPYEWELRVKFHRKHKLRKRSKKLINAVIELYSENKLPTKDASVIDNFLQLNEVSTSIHKNSDLAGINSTFTDSIIKLRQHYVYTKIPEIAKRQNNLDEFKDFIPIHMSYWDIRNKAMAQNILKQVKQHPNNTIVVLTGYYHHYCLTEELKPLEKKYDFTLSNYFE